MPGEFDAGVAHEGIAGEFKDRLMGVYLGDSEPDPSFLWFGTRQDMNGGSTGCADVGITEMVAPGAFMLWLGVLLVVFVATVLRGRRDSFAEATLASAVLALALLHVANPDAWIVRTNVELRRPFDVRYALALGADAVPPLVEILPTLAPAERSALAAGLESRWKQSEGWRTWSFASSLSERSVARMSCAWSCDMSRCVSSRPPTDTPRNTCASRFDE